MVKLTIAGRVNDGLPLSQAPLYAAIDDHNLSFYKQHAEFLLRQISIGALPSSNTTVILHPHCFNYMVRNGVCFITLCDSSYPRELAFHYLQDLQKEFDKFDHNLITQITKPYSFVKFDNIIGSIRRQYVDTRTQANLSKLKIQKQDLGVYTQLQMSLILERKRRLDVLERMMKAHKSDSSIWGSKTLEDIAVKWTPITIIFIVVSVLLWSSLVFKDGLVRPQL